MAGGWRATTPPGTSLGEISPHRVLPRRGLPGPVLAGLLLLGLATPGAAWHGADRHGADRPGGGGTAPALPLAGGELRTHPWPLAAGTFLELRVEQHGADLEVRLRDPAGAVVATVDSPTGRWGDEVLVWIAEGGGEHTVEVRAFPGAGGAYRLRTIAHRRATPRDRRRAALFADLAAAEAWRRAGDRERAGAAYRELLGAARREGFPFLAGEARDRLGRLADAAGRYREAADHLAAAGAAFATAGDRTRQAGAAARRGQALLAADDPTAARESLRAALALRRGTGDHAGLAFLHHALGDAHQLTGEPQRGLDHYRRALDLWPRTGHRREAGDTLHNLGTLYLELGRGDEARRHLERAAAIWRQLGDRGREAVTLDKLALVHLEAGEAGFARRLLLRSLELRGDDPPGRAVTLNHLGLAYRRRGEPLLAAAAYRSALHVLAPLPAERAPADRAALLHNLALVELEGGLVEIALARQLRAVELYRRVGDPAGEAAARSATARSLRRLGRLGEARDALAAATALFEAQRTRPAARRDRIAYFATFQAHYDLEVEVLMELHRRRPAAGHDRAALEASERSKARTLLDVLREDGAGDPPERSAGGRRGADSGSRTGDRIGRRAGGFDLPELAPGTALLEYDLGPERSYLWVLTSDGLASHALPPRRRLEATAEAVRVALARSHRREGRGAAERTLCAASRELLAPAAGALAGARRLVVVGDGPLAALPFAALPEPGGPCPGAPPLLARHTVSQPPSASFLALRRGEPGGWSGTVDVFADPELPADSALPRLPATRLEAGAVGAALEAATSATGDTRRPATARLHLGAAATPAAVARASGAAVLHLATHGVDGAGDPAAAALLLAPDAPGTAGPGSRATSGDGAPRPPGDGGRLTAGEIHALDLDARLVVLSACRTALGREVRGEGILGLGRAFLSSGADRVLVTLWDVGDAATAELMTRFYRHLWSVEGGEPDPTAALAAAQRSLAADPRWSAPYHWAAFVIQG